MVVPHEVEFDLSINLGNILTILSFVCGGIWFITSMRAEAKATRDMTDYRLTALEAQQENTQVELKDLTKVVFTLGEYEKRFDRIEQRIENLSRGEGFKLGLGGAYEHGR